MGWKNYDEDEPLIDRDETGRFKRRVEEGLRIKHPAAFLKWYEKMADAVKRWRRQGAQEIFESPDCKAAPRITEDDLYRYLPWSSDVRRFELPGGWRPAVAFLGQFEYWDLYTYENEFHGESILAIWCSGHRASNVQHIRAVTCVTDTDMRVENMTPLIVGVDRHTLRQRVLDRLQGTY